MIALPHFLSRCVALPTVLVVAALVAIWVGTAAQSSAERQNAAAPAASAVDAAPSTSWEYSPYRILVYVEFDPAPEWTTERRADLLAQLESQSRAIVGGLWRLKAVAAPAELHWNSAVGIARVATDAVLQSARDADKVMLLGIEPPRDGRHELRAREYDVRTQIWGPAQSEVQPTGTDLTQAIVRGLWNTFSPIVRIEEISDQGVVTVTARGGGLPVASRSFEFIPSGTLLRPLIRHFDSKGETVKNGIFSVPWTWLLVNQAEGAAAKCEFVSGVHDPLELKYDGRTEYLGLAVKGRDEHSTELIIQARGPGQRPLEDLEISIRSGDEKTPRLVGRTDERGAIKIDSPAAVVSVFVRSGDDLLAVIPVLPGLETTVGTQVEDNGRRPDTGEFVSRLTEELIDLVAQQTILKARFQRQVVHNNLDEAEKTLAALKGLKTTEAFLKSIDDRRSGMAATTADATAAAWLDSRLEEIKPLAAKYLLDASQLARLESSLIAARRR